MSSAAGLDNTLHGVDFPGTIKDFGQANQYQQTPLCGGPFGANSTYCDTILK